MEPVEVTILKREIPHSIGYHIRQMGGRRVIFTGFSIICEFFSFTAVLEIDWRLEKVGA